MSYGQYSNAPKVSKPAMPKKTSGKREKHVFGSGDTDVSHVWANPLTKDGQGYSQTFGTNSRKNFYFRTENDGTRVLFSYRDNYPIASLFEIGKGKARKRVYLVRSGKAYSTTTASHMRRSCLAVPSREIVFGVPYVLQDDNLDGAYMLYRKPNNATHKANLADIIERLNETITRLTKARACFVMTYVHKEALCLHDLAKNYARTFKCKCPKLPVVPAIDAAKFAKGKEWEATKAARTLALKAKRDAEWAIQNQETIKRWKQGDDVYISGFMGGNALLRVIQNADCDASMGRIAYSVETSQRVIVPVSGLAGAARLFRFLQARKNANKPYERNGHTEHIGQFSVDSFKPAVLLSSPENQSTPEWVLIAGCHRILWSEIESISAQIETAEKAEATQA